ncbi:DUF3826 domain-containing protein [Plebeiibacterium sediminum]|uniref:DUF3826 domain-containing protein n=1 Tax=Plebeiibacterium sediminum TaxID=2992112 RepID=A0AAE3M399_9BACT|nr:DUF3826 domain-containing protein [Plebeiobacterium sediminum]MCW3785965.1 DUF3826 domain-containing protein [Plebeiobacterium sediminum]
MKVLRKYTLIFVLLSLVSSIYAKELSDLEKKATEWIKTLELNDNAKEKRLIKVVTEHLTAVKEWHDSHPFSMVPAGINPRTGDKLTDLDRQIIVDSSIPATVHENLMDGLREDLTTEQVEKVLDCYTVGKVAFTMKAYKEIVPNMTTKEEEVILGNLKKAREMAVDYKSMKEISAIFEIYKTKNEQYLNSNGRNWHQMYKDYVKALKEKKNKK